MTVDRRRVGCLLAAAALVTGGTLATGLSVQVLAGGAIVAGFGLAFYCLGALGPAE